MRSVIISAATLVVIGVSPAATLVAQEPGRTVERTEKGLYLRGAKFSVLETSGLVPTTTVGGVVLFRAVTTSQRNESSSTPFWSSTSMTSMRTTSALVRRVPASTASRSISHMVSVNMGRGTWKVTDGGLQHQ
ncbi:MAG TPA: hypothetical protein VES67_22030 [Vicinamibacterales bacterium]|nr:hypothetical protein [Vicinamibacterales bacterium]